MFDALLRKKLCSVCSTMNLSRYPTKHVSSDEVTTYEETFPAAEKILSDIENIVRKDPELKSFEVIPIQDNENKSPVYHEEHSLGLASWCVQPLYCYVYGRLVDFRRNDSRRQDPMAISRWLMGALFLNPDVTTFWNMKREFVRQGRLNALDELRFTSMVLCYKAKCFEAFAYRRWLLRYLLVGSTDSSEIENLFTKELDVAGVSADRYANNYYAWTQREFVVNTWEKSMTEASYERMLKTEWENSRKWCSRHVSDHSGLAYRQFILKRLLFQRSSLNVKQQSCFQHCTNAVTDEFMKRREYVECFVSTVMPDSSPIFTDSWEYLNFLHSAKSPRHSNVNYDSMLVALSYWAEDCKNNANDILLYPSHEALWYHRRFLGFALVVIENSYSRYFAYKIDNDTAAWRCTNWNTEKKSARSLTNAGPLTLAFHRANEIIVDASCTCSEIQTLSNKFIEYIDDLFCTSSSSKQLENR